MWSPDPFGVFLTGSFGATRPDLVPGAPLWIANPNVAGGKRINKAAFTIPTGAIQGDLGRQRPARIRRYACRFDAAEAVQTPGAAFSSGASGSFQHLQPPQFWPPDQLSEFSSIRAIDADAGSIARKRRPEWRPQSALSNWRPALGATRAEARVLKGKTRPRLSEGIAYWCRIDAEKWIWPAQANQRYWRAILYFACGFATLFVLGPDELPRSRSVDSRTIRHDHGPLLPNAAGRNGTPGTTAPEVFVILPVS